jgi:hypothetical protein
MIDHDLIKRFRFEAAEYTNEIKPLGTTKWNEIRDMKFAELIVRECMRVVGNPTCPNYAYQAIQKHFGVEDDESENT